MVYGHKYDLMQNDYLTNQGLWIILSNFIHCKAERPFSKISYELWKDTEKLYNILFQAKGKSDSISQGKVREFCHKFFYYSVGVVISQGNFVLKIIWAVLIFVDLWPESEYTSCTCGENCFTVSENSGFFVVWCVGFLQ